MNVKGLVRAVLTKLAGGAVMVWVVASFTFFLVHALPGSPGKVAYESYLSQGMSPDEAMAKVAVIYGYTSQDPLATQYVNYVSDLLHGNLGLSISYSGVPVSQVIGNALPWTLIPILSGLLISFAIGTTAGVVAAVKRSSRWGGALSLSASLIAGIPSFVLAILLTTVFHTQLGWLPYGETNDPWVESGWSAAYIGSVAYYAILPVATYVLISYGGWMLSMRSSVASVLGDDFILASELRGITPRTRLRYIGRNAVLPLFTTLAIACGYLFGGAILIENAFNYPGLGRLLLQSIGSRDYPLMTGAFLIITIAVVLANIIADLLYSVIDPRVRR
ncbi:ABC transporter permease [Streptomyces sp. NPDC057684]|uniref:ABC transporter permease n=1 Tax=unclassified Streptomyces TaxID=2593676 RepID=UPI0036A6B45E